MNAYIQCVQTHPLLSASIQFAILGTLGEVLGASAARRKLAIPCTWFQLFLKVLAWALLGVIIKYGFVGMRGFTEALVHKGYLPAFMSQGVGFAFAMSTLTNVFFGPQMMAFHRVEDNLILGQRGFAGLERAIKTLVWFWIPAHTITFSLPVDYQIGLAALWGLVLGLILGLAKPAAPAAS
jgi:hypothetical protein